MNINYPVVYALMELEEQNGWSLGTNELARNFEPSGYIVSKCYVVGEKTIYNKDGTNETEYEVVFPYTTENIQDEFGIVPQYNFCGKVNNSVIVQEVFLDVLDALYIEHIKNKEILSKKLTQVSFNKDINEQIENIKNKYYENMVKYKTLELKICEKTLNMETLKNKNSTSKVFKK